MDIGLSIKQLDNEIKKTIDKKLKCFDVTSIQGFIIKFIYNSKKEVVQRDIEENLNLKRSTISEVLSLMEQKGLIIRIKDGRNNIIVLTEKAINIHNEIRLTVLEIEKKLKKNIKKEELDLFIEISNRMKNNLMEDE